MEEIWNKPVQAVNAVSNWCIKINRVKKFLKKVGTEPEWSDKKIQSIITEGT
jgi:hypothetical protein